MGSLFLPVLHQRIKQGPGWPALHSVLYDLPGGQRLQIKRQGQIAMHWRAVKKQAERRPDVPLQDFLLA